MRNETAHIGARNLAYSAQHDLMTRQQVSELLQVSPITIIRWEAAGKLPAIRLGAGSVRYRRSAVEKLIQDSITAVS